MTSARSVSLRVGILITVMLALAGCSVTETVVDILSSTTPGDWYDQDGMPKAEYKVDVFVALNLNNLKTDIARGHGEYLTSVADLLTVPPDRRPEFFGLAQARYPTLVREDQAGVTRTLLALSRDAGATPGPPSGY